MAGMTLSSPPMTQGPLPSSSGMRPPGPPIARRSPGLARYTARPVLGPAPGAGCRPVRRFALDPDGAEVGKVLD